MSGLARGVALASVALVATLVLIPVVRAQAPSNLAGTWKLNLAKSTFSPGPPPKSMTVNYTPVKDAVRIRVDLVPATGAEQHWDMTPNYDGKDYPVKGNPDVETVSVKRLDAHHGETTMKKDGKVVVVNSRALSEDGKTLTITAKGKDGQGQPRNDVMVFEK